MRGSKGQPAKRQLTWHGMQGGASRACSSLWRSRASAAAGGGACSVAPSLASMSGMSWPTSGSVSAPALRTASLIASNACACSRAASCSPACRCACAGHGAGACAFQGCGRGACACIRAT
jgi:hypothetical protein